MATNKNRGSFEFKHEGETYRFKFDFNALCTLEEETGKSFLELQNVQSNTMNTLRVTFWAGLQSSHPGLTLTEAGDLIDGVGLLNILGMVGDAVSGAMSEDVKPKKTKGGKTKARVKKQPTAAAQQGTSPPS